MLLKELAIRSTVYKEINHDEPFYVTKDWQHDLP